MLERPVCQLTGVRRCLASTLKPNLCPVFDAAGLLDVMVFFVGGITCQEARVVNEFNAEMCSSGAGGRRTIRVICGGDFISSMAGTAPIWLVRQAYARQLIKTDLWASLDDYFYGASLDPNND